MAIFFTLVFLAVMIVPIALIWRRAALFLPCFAVFLIIFIPILHLQQATSDKTWELGPYLVAHFAWAAFLWLTLGIALLFKKYLLDDSQIVQVSLRVPDQHLIGAFLAWSGFKVYLIAVYGVEAFRTFSWITGEATVGFRFQWWETAVSHFLMHFAVGACVVYTIKLVFIEAYWKRVWILASCLVFLAPFLIALESPIGSRRFVLILVIAALVLAYGKGTLSISTMTLRKWAGAALLVIGAVGVSSYYQAVRNNYFSAEISQYLTSNRALDVVQGTLLALIPNPDSSTFELDSALTREGPLELVYDVVRLRLDGHRGTEGSITVNSLAALVPRWIVGEAKVIRNADEVIAEQMSIQPEVWYLMPDMATSLLAIGIADFGILLGFLFATIVMMAGFLVASVIARTIMRIGSPFLFFALAVLIHLAGSVETDLGLILVVFRDAIIVLLVAACTVFIAGQSWRGRVDAGSRP